MAKHAKREAKLGIPKLPASCYKPSKTKQLAAVFAKLQQLLLTEWPIIKRANLGVKSGTGIIDDVLLLQLHQLSVQLHTLAVSNEEACSMLVQLVAKMDEQHLQQLHVLLDVLGHEELSDYLTLLVPQQTCKCSCSKGQVAAGETPAVPAAPYAREHKNARAITSGLGNQLLMGPEPAEQPLALDTENSNGTEFCSTRRQSIGYQSLPDLNSLRFATLLPPGHMLTKTAEQLQRKHEFEAALRAAETAKREAALAAKQARVPKLPLPGSRQQQRRPGSSGSHGSYSMLSSTPGSVPLSPFKWAAEDGAFGLGKYPGYKQPGFMAFQFTGAADVETSLSSTLFQAPRKSVEQLWKDGRLATTEAVLTRAQLEVHDSPLNILVLEPVCAKQPRFKPPPSPQLLDISAVEAVAMGQVGSRPNSARRAVGNNIASTSRPASARSRPVSSRRCTRLTTCDTDVGLLPVTASTAGSGSSSASMCAGGFAGQTGRHGLPAIAEGSGLSHRGDSGTSSRALNSSCAAELASSPVSQSVLGVGVVGGGSSSSSSSPGPALSFTPRRAAITAGIRGAGINLLEGCAEGSHSAAPVQMSRLGSPQSPREQQFGLRPTSAASTARSRSGSAPKHVVLCD